MKKSLSWTTLGLAATLISSQAFGALSFPTLSQATTDQVTSELAATLAFRPVEGSSTPNIFGFYIGSTVTAASTAPIQSIVGNGLPYLPMVEIAAGVAVPFGLALEVGYLPSVSLTGMSWGKFGADIKWNFSKILLPILPLDLSIRGMYTGASFGVTQPLGGATVNVNYNSTIMGALLGVSKSFFIIEPYAGIGFLNQNSTLSATGTTASQLFSIPAVTTSANSSTSTAWFQAGLQFKAIFMLAAEYDNLWGADTFSVKAGFKF